MIFDTTAPRQARAVTLSDTVDLPDGECSGFWVGSAGDVVYIPAGMSTPITLKNMPVGGYRIAAKRFYSTGTGATNLVAFYS